MQGIPTREFPLGVAMDSKNLCQERCISNGLHGFFGGGESATLCSDIILSVTTSSCNKREINYRAAFGKGRIKLYYKQDVFINSIIFKTK